MTENATKPSVTRELWPGFDSLKSLVLVREMAVPADNHEPFRWSMLVRISPNAAEAYRNWRTGDSLAVGTSIVAEHRSRQNSIQGPYYFANKTEQGWQFGSATADGWLLEPSNSCSLCHSEAVADHVFGLHPLAPSGPDTKRPDGG